MLQQCQCIHFAHPQLCAPNAIVEAARDPLPDDVSSLVCLHKRLVVVDIDKVGQCFALNCNASVKLQRELV